MPEVESKFSQVNMGDLILFRLGGRSFALRGEHVREILQVSSITKVHQAPEHVLGVINLRGDILTLIDLCSRLGIRIRQFSEKKYVIVVSHRSEVLGLEVDQVEDIVRADPDYLLPPPSGNGSSDMGFEAVYQNSDQLIAVLDLNHFL